MTILTKSKSVTYKKVLSKKQKKCTGKEMKDHGVLRDLSRTYKRIFYPSVVVHLQTTPIV